MKRQGRARRPIDAALNVDIAGAGALRSRSAGAAGASDYRNISRLEIVGDRGGGGRVDGEIGRINQPGPGGTVKSRRVHLRADEIHRAMTGCLDEATVPAERSSLCQDRAS